uniref:Uncharacterized protein n=1 Tax=Anguilla anguilla TaxID=7936 RepID=A0A0E9W866_ANGAN
MNERRYQTTAYLSQSNPKCKNQKTAEYSKEPEMKCRTPDLDAGFRCPLPTVTGFFLRCPKTDC